MEKSLAEEEEFEERRALIKKHWNYMRRYLLAKKEWDNAGASFRVCVGKDQLTMRYLQLKRRRSDYEMLLRKAKELMLSHQNGLHL